MMKVIPTDIVDWLRTTQRERVASLAREAVGSKLLSVTSVDLPRQAIEAGAVPGDYYSMGDYWWPNTETSSGLPYVRRDGESNPDNFSAHRLILRRVRDQVAALSAGYLLLGDPRFAERAAEQLHVFFVAKETRMHPHLRYAQAIPGITSGRGIGIIDTLHLVEILPALEVIESVVGDQTVSRVRDWFAEYLHWMQTHPNGREEAKEQNNHRVAYWLQAAVFAKAIGNEDCLDLARRELVERILPEQMAPDGSFPRELERTKPYGYSIFQVDNLALLTEVLSTNQHDLWQVSLPGDRSMRKALDFLYPYLLEKEKWPFGADVSHFGAWPVQGSGLLFGGIRLGKPDYLDLWQRLDSDPVDLEVRRNLATTQPVLWLR